MLREHQTAVKCYTKVASGANMYEDLTTEPVLIGSFSCSSTISHYTTLLNIVLQTIAILNRIYQQVYLKIVGQNLTVNNEKISNIIYK